jgi:hypothetical protein
MLDMPTTPQESAYVIRYDQIYFLLLSDLKASMRALSSSFGLTSSSFKGTRLKGSVESLSKCAFMVDKSMVVFDDGKITGFSISVKSKGSVE